MTNKQIVHISKFMSLILRHEPEKFGVTLDGEGFVLLGELLSAIQKQNPEVTLEDLRTVVSTNEPQKQRFSIVDDEIRANYGHSVEGKVQHEASEPPEILYHGTNEEVRELIYRKGLLPMRRQYVHLTTDLELARKVGSRRGKPIIFEVSAKVAHGEGVLFYRANQTFWLVDAMPSIYLMAL